MSQAIHTYGPTCQRARTVTLADSKDHGEVPPLKPQFFYSSRLSIDDPMSAIPAATGADAKTGQQRARPFTASDNNALEETWLSLSTRKGAETTSDKPWRRCSGIDRAVSEISPLDAKTEKIPKYIGRSMYKIARKAVGLTSLDDNEALHATQVEIVGARSSSDPSIEQSEGSRSPKHGQAAHSHRAAGDVYSDQSAQERSSENEDFPNENVKDLKLSTQTAFECRDRAGEGSIGVDYDPHRQAQEVPVSSISPPLSLVGNERMDTVRRKYFIEVSEDASSEAWKTIRQKNEPAQRHEAQQYCSIQPNDSDFDQQQDQRHDIQNPIDDAILVEVSVVVDRKKRSKAKATAGGPNPKLSVVDDMSKVRQAEAPRASLEQTAGNGQYDCHVVRPFTKTSHNEDVKSANDDSRCNVYKPAVAKHDRPEPQALPFSEHLVTTSSGITSDQLNESTPKTLQRFSLYSGAQASETGTTGLPFVKLPDRHNSTLHTYNSPKRRSDKASEASSHTHNHNSTEEQSVYGCKAHKGIKKSRDLTVGVSRLHFVKLPDLQLAPIYWSPVHDTAIVSRGTWFYRDTMLPVEAPVANQLEMGYRELRPWSKTWSDELKSALEVGAAAEEKVAYRLWPKEAYLKRDAHKDNVLAIDSFCAASCFHGEVAAEGLLNSDDVPAGSKITKKYLNCQVIFKDIRHAYILKPNLQPSEYHGRRPVHRIMKGATVGVAVVRGFDWEVWDKLYPPKRSVTLIQADAQIRAGNDFVTDNAKGVCVACAAQEERKTPTDLILVIHGIGQKLSERMESFHFTHAMNAFRRSVHVELANPDVQNLMRKELGGIMVLPVNWRSGLSFDTNQSNAAERDFTLKDITPDTIPAVRNMISDVMLDIPFYMSVHKGKVIEAVIKEANRVYRLWCKNNLGFEREGRTHIIAHSLGSAIALEALSRQPNVHPKVNVLSSKVNSKCFDFDTTNLFFVGSPAAFFLFLDGAKLLPRRGQNKPGAHPEEYSNKAVTGEVGTFGCMPVDNVYNVMHYNDPIAYRMNATIENKYAATLKTAKLPNTTIGFINSLVKAISPAAAPSRRDATGHANKPAAIARLPSQLEMEEHDFNREEIAEKKSYLLNDNGQIDWYTNAGQGAFDNQYINMLGAHSSYWTSPDFIKMVVIEVGRKPGRQHALPAMKAAKIKK